MSEFTALLKSNLNELNKHLRVVITKTEELHSLIIQYRTQKQIKASEELAHMNSLLHSAGVKFEEHFNTMYGKLNATTIDQCIEDYSEDVELKSLFLTLRSLKNDFKIKTDKIVNSNNNTKEFVDKTMKDMGVEEPKKKSKKLRNTFYGR